MKLLVLSLLICAAVALDSADPTDPPNPNVDLPGEKPTEEGDTGLESVDETEMSEDEYEESSQKVKRSCSRAADRWHKYGSRYYIFVTTPRPWTWAQLHCQSLGGTLAAIHNSAMNTFVKSSLANGRVAWIGLSDAQYDRYWLWINGERWVYANWCRGEPNNSGRNEECLAINWTANKCWNDYKCRVKLPYVCEKK